VLEQLVRSRKGFAGDVDLALKSSDLEEAINKHLYGGGRSRIRNRHEAKGPGSSTEDETTLSVLSTSDNTLPPDVAGGHSCRDGDA